MKSKLFSAALVLTAAVLAPAHAATVLMTNLVNSATPGNIVLYNTVGGLTTTSTANVVTAAGFLNGLGEVGGNINTPSVNESKPKPVDIATDSSNKPGLGITGQGFFIDGGYANNLEDFVVLDFSGAKVGGTPTSVKFGLNIDNPEVKPGGSFIAIYGVTGTAGQAGATYTLLASPEMIAKGLISTSGLSFFTSYVLGVQGDCGFDITSVTVTYGTVPEPGTFLLAGMALLGLGVTMKKRSRNV